MCSASDEIKDFVRREAKTTFNNLLMAMQFAFLKKKIFAHAWRKYNSFPVGQALMLNERWRWMIPQVDKVFLFSVEHDRCGFES